MKITLARVKERICGQLSDGTVVALFAAIVSFLPLGNVAEGYGWSSYGGTPLTWSGARANMGISTYSMPAGSIWDVLLQNAMYNWNTGNGSTFRFYYFRWAASSTSFPDGINQVDFKADSAFDPGILAHTLSRWQGTSRIEADIAFNISKTWGTSNPDYSDFLTGSISFESTALHELGHALGLNHENRWMATMNSYYPNSGPLGRYLSWKPLADDLTGLRFLYPAGASITDIAGSAFKWYSSGYGYLIFPLPTTKAGDPVDVEYSFMNRGTTQQTFNVGFFLSASPYTSPSDLLLGQASWISPAGSVGTFVQRVQIPATTVPGTYYLGVVTDPFNGVADVDLDNNFPKTAYPITITPGAATNGVGTVVINPYGALSVQGATLAGNTISDLQQNATIQLGNIAGTAGSFIAIDFGGFSLASGRSLTIKSGAAGQTVLLSVIGASASAIDGFLQTQSGGAFPPPKLSLSNPNGFAISSGGAIFSTAGLTLDVMSATRTNGEKIVNEGALNGGSSLQLFAGAVNGGGWFMGDNVLLSTLRNANNPVYGAHYLSNGLQLYPYSGNNVALSVNHFGALPQFLNLMVNGNGTLSIPSSWPFGTNLPPNNASVPAGGSRPPGLSDPAFGGGSMIVQASGMLSLDGGASNDLVFPGGIALKSLSTLNLNGVLVNQGWTTSGKAFQGVFVESPNIVSNGNIRIQSNNLNWINFSSMPHAPVRTWTLVSTPDGGAVYATADTIAPHLNTYSILIEAAANGQCWLCLINSTPVNMY